MYAVAERKVAPEMLFSIDGYNAKGENTCGKVEESMAKAMKAFRVMSGWPGVVRVVIDVALNYP